MDTKVLVGIPTTSLSRFAEFYDAVELMIKPEGTWMTRTHGQSPAHNRNIIIDQAFENKCSHILFLDDDVIPPKDTLVRLLAHNLDIVGGHYLMRNFPHQPIAFSNALPDGACEYLINNDLQTGVIEVVATGLGCCLIKTSVFEGLKRPYIRLGELQADHWCDDLGFFKRVREAGYKIHVDLDLLVGHYATVVVEPIYQDRKWMVGYETNGRGKPMFFR